LKRTVGVLLLLSIVLLFLTACGGGGGSGGSTPTGSQDWDTMVWDNDNWA